MAKDEVVHVFVNRVIHRLAPAVDDLPFHGELFQGVLFG
jgi:hypothetical protein